jgi:hypothetical protein
MQQNKPFQQCRLFGVYSLLSSACLSPASLSVGHSRKKEAPVYKIPLETEFSNPNPEGLKQNAYALRNASVLIYVESEEDALLAPKNELQEMQKTDAAKALITHLTSGKNTK